MNRMLSAQQIRAGRGLLVGRVETSPSSPHLTGAIKAIEQGTTDARLSTLRKLAQTFTAHGVEFVATGPWTGVVTKKRARSVRPRRHKSRVDPKRLRRQKVPRLPTRVHIAATSRRFKALLTRHQLEWLGPLHPSGSRAQGVAPSDQASTYRQLLAAVGEAALQCSTWFTVPPAACRPALRERSRGKKGWSLRLPRLFDADEFW